MAVRSSLPWMCALVVAGAWLAVDAPDARACGGCFHQPPSPEEVDGTVVTDHRMAVSISPTQTILWDQVEYSGNPSDFAWVLPVKPGAQLQLSQDSWLASLDAATETIIQGPTPNCPGATAPTEYDDDSGGGCGASSESAAAFGAGGAAEVDAGAAGTPVDVVSQEVVGPYEAVTVRSSQGEALGDWLRAHGYAVPESIQPTIDAYTSEGFDFIALRLAPGEGVQAMQPVRVLFQGASLSLPLRMVAAGVGANVGIELYVLSDGRYQPQNFPQASIDFTQLAWDPFTNSSNYTQLQTTALAADGGTAWLTEESAPVNLFGGSGLNPGLESAYDTSCSQITLPPPASCGELSEAGLSEAGLPASDAGGAASDAGEEAGTAEDGGLEGSDGGSCQSTIVACDDLDLAMQGIPAGSLWVTRLRAFLPQSALSADLVLAASPSQAEVTNLHTATQYTDPSYNPCPATNGATSGGGGGSVGCGCKTEDSPRGRYADAVLAILLFVGTAGAVRRRRRVC